MDKTAAIRRALELYTGLNRLILDRDPLGASWGGQVADEFSDEVWRSSLCSAM